MLVVITLYRRRLDVEETVYFSEHKRIAYMTHRCVMREEKMGFYYSGLSAAAGSQNEVTGSGRNLYGMSHNDVRKVTTVYVYRIIPNNSSIRLYCFCSSEIGKLILTRLYTVYIF